MHISRVHAATGVTRRERARLKRQRALGEVASVLRDLAPEGHDELEARLALRAHPPDPLPHASHGVDERAVRHQGLVHQAGISGDGLNVVARETTRRVSRGSQSRDADVRQVAQESRNDAARDVGFSFEHLGVMELEAVLRNGGVP